MSKQLDDLNAKVDELQTTVDDVQQKVADRIAADVALIAELQAKIDSGAGVTAADLQSVIDKVQSAKDDLSGTSV